MSNTNATENTSTLPLTEADINKPQAASAPAAGTSKAKATKPKTKTTPAMSIEEAASLAADEEETKTNTQMNSVSASEKRINDVLSACGKGSAIATAAARTAFRECKTISEMAELMEGVEASKNINTSDQKDAVSQLSKLMRRVIELTDRPTSKAMIGKHGVYAGLTPSGTYGAELGVVSEREDGTHAHTGFGFYFRCEHLEPYEGPALDSSGIIKK
jgi:hypothetical protein